MADNDSQSQFEQNSSTVNETNEQDQESSEASESRTYTHDESIDRKIFSASATNNWDQPAAGGGQYDDYSLYLQSQNHSDTQ